LVIRLLASGYFGGEVAGGRRTLSAQKGRMLGRIKSMASKKKTTKKKLNTAKKIEPTKTLIFKY
jgi:hypothetical protein